MKTIVLNSKKMNITQRQIDAMKILKGKKFVSLKGEFSWGSGRHRKNLISQMSKEEMNCAGIKSNYTDLTAEDHRVRKFTAEHPRATFCITGNARRINAILKKVALS
jgi:hypothetical protein